MSVRNFKARGWRKSGAIFIINSGK